MMNHGSHFDRMNKADRLRAQGEIERVRKKHEARERLDKAAPALLEACIRAKAYLASLPGKYAVESRYLQDEIKVAIAQAEKEG